MYSLSDYHDMFVDPVRRDAYVRAMEAAIHPGSTVVEIGTGVGYFAIMACRAGAGRVYAIEPDPAIHVALELARANGCADRIQFIQDVSTRVSIEPADVLVSDLRGVLPFSGLHIPAIVDARRRLLKPGGVQIPRSDTIWLALVSAPAGDLGALAPTRPDPYGIGLHPLERALSNSWSKRRVAASQLMTAPARWHTLDYYAVELSDAEGEVDVEAIGDGYAQGISVWFDTDLYGGEGFTNAPGSPEVVYGQVFFPLPTPIQVERGDVMRIAIRAKLVGAHYVWSWRGRVENGRSAGQEFAQSTFHGTPMAAATLRKRADSFVPRLGREGATQAWVLSRMSASATLRDIAEEAMTTFPGFFRDFQEALTYAAELSQQFSE